MSSSVELEGAAWRDIALALDWCGHEHHAPLTPARAADLSHRIRGQLPEAAAPLPQSQLTRFVALLGPIVNNGLLWLVVDSELNVIVATWSSRVAAEADAWHRNRLVALEAAEDREWGLRR